MAKRKRKRSRGEGAVYSYLTTGGKNVRWRVEPVGGGAGGKAGFKTEQEALAWQKANQNQPPAAGTVGEWLARWLELHRADVAKATYVHDAGRVRRFLAPMLGGVKLRDLTGYDVAQMLARMAEKHSPSERHKAGRVLRQALNAAVALGVLGANPMTSARGRVKLPGPQHAEKLAFTPEQVKKLLVASDAQGKGHQLRLFLDAGLRPGELLGLDWEDIDLDKGTVRIVRSLDASTHKLKDVKTKGSRRTIRLSTQTTTSLRVFTQLAGKVNKPSGPFMRPPRSAGGRYWQSEFYRTWVRPLYAAAGLGGLGAGSYACRHTCATHLLRSGVPVMVVSRRLGHTSAKMTLDCYGHVLEGDEDLAADVMGKLMG